MPKRYKGRYVAQVEIDFDIDATRPNINSFAEIKESISNKTTPALKEVVEDEFAGEFGTVTVTQQYADLYEVVEDVDDR